MPTDPHRAAAAVAADLTATARRRLLDLRRHDGGWSYRPQSRTSAVEPTALASLALLATAAPDDTDGPSVPLHAGRWIAAHARRLDGSTLVAPGLAVEPGWTTPVALLLWNALGGFDRERSEAVAWLLTARGKPGQPIPRNPMGHDVTLVGWPWVADTHSWVEPTATSLLALAPRVAPSQPRMAEGVRLLLDRAIATGGWNLGNPIVFGQTFRALPGPTGLALLALARLARESAPPATIAAAVTYLESVLPRTAAPTSLGWATLGLRAWQGALDAESRAHLASATARALARAATPGELALLLLAAGDRSLGWLGIPLDGESEPRR